jgi:hypothetical protein
MSNTREASGTKKMWSHFHGIVDVKELSDEEYPLTYSKDRCFRSFTSKGIYDTHDTHPILISIEQAEKQGLVRKVFKTSEALRVKYKTVDEKGMKEISITSMKLKNKIEFDKYFPCYKFVSFIDENLNECPPPNKEEWEEVQQ